MALSKAKKDKLKAAGLNASALKKLEEILDADDGDADNGDKPSGSRRVVVYEGDDAESFMVKMFGGKPKDEDEGSEGDESDEGDEDDEGDEEPPSGPKWFR